MMHWHVVDVELDGHFFAGFANFKPYWTLISAMSRREVLNYGRGTDYTWEIKECDNLDCIVRGLA